MGKIRNKITVFLPNLEAGGAERITINLFSAINREIFDLTLLLGEKKGYFLSKIPKDFPIVDLKTSSSLRLIFKIASYLKEEKPDIFMSLFPRFNMISIFANILSGTKTKIIIAEHTTFSCIRRTAKNYFRRFFVRFIFPYLMKIFYPKAKTIICVSQGVAQDLLKIVNIPNKIKIIYNPIIGKDIDYLLGESLEHPWFSEQKIPIVIAVGRLTKAKDYPNLLRAFSLVLKEQPARLMILGEGEERRKLEKLIKQLNISKNVALLGFQENPYKYMTEASVFVLSSFQEGFPTVIIEAMVCGIPVIATDCPSGPREVIRDRENGFLVPVSDPKKLARAILILLRSPALRKKFIEEAKKGLEDFSVKEATKKYENIFLNK